MLVLVNKNTGKKITTVVEGRPFRWSDKSLCLNAIPGIGRGMEIVCEIVENTVGNGPVLVKTTETYDKKNNKWKVNHKRGQMSFDALKILKRRQLCSRRHAAELLALEIDGHQHIADCFANESRLDTLIDFAKSETELDEINLDEGWPFVEEATT